MLRNNKTAARLAMLAAIYLTIFGVNSETNAFSVIVTPPPTTPPQTLPLRPSFPYISGRLGAAKAATDPPVGSVIPDDFCLPGKFEDCGEHLRESATNSNNLEEGLIFVGRDDLAFGQARQKVWVNAQSRQIDLNSISEQQSINSVSVGGDRRFGEKFTLGAMVVRESKTTTYSSTGIQDNQTGFQAGPYFVYPLSNSLVLDGRLIFGNSDHTVTTAGSTSGLFQSQSGFAALRISGTFNRRDWRLHPSLELAKIIQSNEAYVDSVSGAVAASTVSETFATVAALAYYDGLGVGNGNLTPYVGLELTQPINGGGGFGTFRIGSSLALGNGMVLNIDYAHGAIGLANTKDRLVSFQLELPF